MLETTPAIVFSTLFRLAGLNVTAAVVPALMRMAGYEALYREA